MSFVKCQDIRPASSLGQNCFSLQISFLLEFPLPSRTPRAVSYCIHALCRRRTEGSHLFFFFSSIYFFLYFQLLKLNQLTTCVLSWTKLFSYKISSCPSPQIINSVCELTEQEQDFQQLDNKLESSEGKGTATTATEAVWDGTEPVNLSHRSLLV